jgi:hypothetical protein
MSGETQTPEATPKRTGAESLANGAKSQGPITLYAGSKLVLQPEPSSAIPLTQYKPRQFKQIANKSTTNFLGSPPGLPAFLSGLTA